MSISFECQNCHKKIKAPAAAGGKRGNCPHCKTRCFVPSEPEADFEEFKLIPIDDEDELAHQQFKEQAYSITKDIYNQKSAEGSGTFNDTHRQELLKNIIQYLRFMADGELPDAEAILPRISKHGIKAKSMIAELIRQEEAEPELADIAPQVLKALMQALQGEF
jgi:hypothetical protein